MSIKETIFFVESFAHLQGHEKTLLPIVEAARAEQEELVTTLRELVFWYANRDCDDHILQGGQSPEITRALALLGKQDETYQVSPREVLPAKRPPLPVVPAAPA